MYKRQHLHGRKIGQSYCTYFLTEACITNPEALDKWLLNNGYIRMPNIHEVLSLYNIKELKCFLQSFGLKISGKKDELISRLIDNAPSDFLEDVYKRQVSSVLHTLHPHIRCTGTWIPCRRSVYIFLSCDAVP